jgi:CBS domain-containing protein
MNLELCPCLKYIIKRIKLLPPVTVIFLIELRIYHGSNDNVPGIDDDSRVSMKHNKIPLNSSIKDTLQTMQLNNIRRLPIFEKEESDNMIGIITDQDVFTDYNEKSKFDTCLIRR